MKKRVWQRTGACLLGAALLVACVAAGGALAEKTEQPDAAPVAQGEAITGFARLAESDTAVLCLDAENHSFYVENKATGYRWGNIPSNVDALEIDDYQRDVMRSMVTLHGYDPVNKALTTTVEAYADAIAPVTVENEDTGEKETVYPGSVRYEAVENGFKVIYTLTTADVVLPMTVTLVDDHVVARVNTEEIRYDEQKFILLNLHILPYMGAVSSDGADAYAVIPDGSGALVYANRVKENAPAYHRPVYGKDVAVADTDFDGITLPCFGAVDGGDALLAVISADEEDAYINCSGRSGSLLYTRAWASFKTMADFEYALVSDYYSTQVYEEGGIKAKALEVSYYPLNGEAAGYAQMATKYRELLFSGIRTGAAKIEPALYLDLYASVKKVRSVLGFKSGYNAILTSTADVETILQALTDKQVGSTVVRYNAWNKQAGKGQIPTKLDAIGGVGDVAALVKQAATLNSRVYPALNSFLSYSTSPNPFHTMNGTARDMASRLIMDTEPYLTTSLVGERYLQSFGSLTDKLTRLLDGAADRFESLALGDVGHFLYSDFSKGSYKRPVVAEAIGTRLADFAADNALMLEAPNAYAGKYATEILGLPAASSGNILLDEDVPFLQMVYSGRVRYATEALNLSGNPRASFLKALEYGSMPCYAWIGGAGSSLINTELDYLYSAEYAYWLDTAAEQYRAVSELVKATEGTAMADHSRLAEGVYVTTYANGARIAVNYTDTAYTLGSESVPAAGYRILSEG